MSDNIKDVVKSVELEKNSNCYICEWGTKHKENPPNEETNRTDFRRQRDRILYTGGFRRLQGKTQVIAASKNGDHRTRLTHSLEVEQIAVSIADALGLNRDLVSAIALGHDVGHTPFGHAVERFLNKQLKDKGGFSHAVQSVRYLKNKGITLSYEVFEGILKHDTDVYAGSYNKEQFDCSEYDPLEPGSLEAQVVYWADKLAYLTHDFEDFYTQIYESVKDQKLEDNLKEILSNIITEDEKSEKIKNDLKNFETRDLIRNVLKNLIDESFKNIMKLKESKTIIDIKVIRDETKERIKRYEQKLGINEDKSTEEINKIKKKSYQKGLIINFKEEYVENYLKLRDIINEHYLGSPEIERSDAKAEKIVSSLYKDFINNYKILPINIRKKIDVDKENLERVVADYISSMTDRYAEEVFIDLNSIGNHYHD
ncbi:dNTP triphosphohydrolase [Clostridium botulinum]|nr:dNTP triphosphohydrolase [Clostridium botulinum]NFS52668.1 dNTP triphosphohydrolase [Clostridium botulinum]NFT18882.1 dNTP triphosphohydrolase [Clostridium botulinum]